MHALDHHQHHAQSLGALVWHMALQRAAVQLREALLRGPAGEEILLGEVSTADVGLALQYVVPDLLPPARRPLVMLYYLEISKCTSFL